MSRAKKHRDRMILLDKVINEERDWKAHLKNKKKSFDPIKKKKK